MKKIHSDISIRFRDLYMGISTVALRNKSAIKINQTLTELKFHFMEY